MGGTTNEKEVTRIIEGVQTDRGIHRSEAISYEAETEGRKKHEHGPGDGMVG